jgi:probable rRNA maturation factor
VIKNLEVYSETKHKVKKTLVKKVVLLLKKDLNFEISSLIINFVSAAKITLINSEFLDHHYSITFNYSDNLAVLDTELYISAEDALENAARFRAAFEEEIIRLMIHGILHVSGFDDKTPSDRARMKRMENRLLNKYKIVLLGKKEAL